jgi:GTP cyclohydrolase II
MTIESGLAERTATRWTTREGVEFQAAIYTYRGTRMVALSHGDLADGRVPLVRLHSACLTSEVLGSTRCDCRDQLDEAFRRVGEEGSGLIVYFLDQEGRGIGIEDKLAAYALQDGGVDTVAANIALGLPVDDRDFSGAADLLRDLGIDSVRLMTNNPEKIQAVEDAGIEVERVSAWVSAPESANEYLDHKISRMSHLR